MQLREFKSFINLAVILLIFISCSIDRTSTRKIMNFNKEWKFFLGDAVGASDPDYNASEWRNLNLPHEIGRAHV